MKRKNLDYPKLRRSSRRSKINENLYGNTFIYLKFFLIWAVVLLADFILEFRFEYLWPFWLLIRSVYDSFKYQGLAFSIFFICIALTSDMICLLSIPVHWLFFAASTYVWVQFIWHTERGICLPTISLWLLFVYIEASVRLRELKNVPFHLDLCRPFAAHCIGYPMVTLGFGFKSYITYRLRQKKQKYIAKENNFYYGLLKKALPDEYETNFDDMSESNYTSEQTKPSSHVYGKANGHINFSSEKSEGNLISNNNFANINNANSTNYNRNISHHRKKNLLSQPSSQHHSQQQQLISNGHHYMPSCEKNGHVSLSNSHSNPSMKNKDITYDDTYESGQLQRHTHYGPGGLIFYSISRFITFFISFVRFNLVSSNSNNNNNNGVYHQGYQEEDEDMELELESLPTPKGADLLTLQAANDDNEKVVVVTTSSLYRNGISRSPDVNNSSASSSASSYTEEEEGEGGERENKQRRFHHHKDKHEGYFAAEKSMNNKNKSVPVLPFEGSRNYYKEEGRGHNNNNTLTTYSQPANHRKNNERLRHPTTKNSSSDERGSSCSALSTGLPRARRHHHHDHGEDEMYMEVKKSATAPPPFSSLSTTTTARNKISLATAPAKTQTAVAAAIFSNYYENDDDDHHPHTTTLTNTLKNIVVSLSNHLCNNSSGRNIATHKPKMTGDNGHVTSHATVSTLSHATCSSYSYYSCYDNLATAGTSSCAKNNLLVSAATTTATLKLSSLASVPSSKFAMTRDYVNSLEVVDFTKVPHQQILTPITTNTPGAASTACTTGQPSFNPNEFPPSSSHHRLPSLPRSSSTRSSSSAPSSSFDENFEEAATIPTSNFFSTLSNLDVNNNSPTIAPGIFEVVPPTPLPHHPFVETTTQTQLMHHQHNVTKKLLPGIIDKDLSSLSDIYKMEIDVKKLKNDLQASRLCENELRNQVTFLQNSDKCAKNEMYLLKLENESLLAKINNLQSFKHIDKQQLVLIEKKLTEEQKVRAKLEAQLIDKKYTGKQHKDDSSHTFGNHLTATTSPKNECSESCKNRRKDLENDIRQLCKDAKTRDDQLWSMEKEIQSLRTLKDQKSENDMLLNALNVLKNKNAHLETSLNAETKLKLDLFSALSEAKRNLEINQTMLVKREREINDLKVRLSSSSDRVTPILNNNNNSMAADHHHRIINQSAAPTTTTTTTFRAMVNNNYGNGNVSPNNSCCNNNAPFDLGLLYGFNNAANNSSAVFESVTSAYNNNNTNSYVTTTTTTSCNNMISNSSNAIIFTNSSLLDYPPPYYSSNNANSSSFPFHNNNNNGNYYPIISPPFSNGNNETSPAAVTFSCITTQGFNIIAATTTSSTGGFNKVKNTTTSPVTTTTAAPKLMSLINFSSMLSNMAALGGGGGVNGEISPPSSSTNVILPSTPLSGTDFDSFVAECLGVCKTGVQGATVALPLPPLSPGNPPSYPTHIVPSSNKSSFGGKGSNSNNNDPPPLSSPKTRSPVGSSIVLGGIPTPHQSAEYF